MIGPRQTPGKHGLLYRLLCVMASIYLPANISWSEDADRFEQLIYGEALFHSHQQDYLSAINRLELAEAQGLVTTPSEDYKLLLARMKLSYGLHLEAGFNLHALLDESVPPMVRNRAWCELGRLLFHSGYSETSAEVLAHIQGDLPAELVGDCQLLQAMVLMSLDRNHEAADVLARWGGAAQLAGYAHYNRGIALMRTGDTPQAVSALRAAVKMPAGDEELLALRDRSRLALGYIYARTENYDSARREFGKVREPGPFSTRALLALGWLAYKQGNRESALRSWKELLGRDPTDPAVLESLLVVPTVYRELEAMQTASRDYQSAVTVYDKELSELQTTREAVKSVGTRSLLEPYDDQTARPAKDQPAQGSRRFLESLLATRDFRIAQENRDQLHALLEEADRGLQAIEALSKGADPAAPTSTGTGSPPIPPPPRGERPSDWVAPDKPRTWERGRSVDDTTGAQGQQPVAPDRWEVEGGKSGIPPLPEIQSPRAGVVKPLPTSRSSGLPESEILWLPESGGYIREVPSPEITGLPESRILWLPESGEFFRRPGEAEYEDYAYPDSIPPRRTPRRGGNKQSLDSILPFRTGKEVFSEGAVPVGEALRELAEAFGDTTQRASEFGSLFDHAVGPGGMQEEIASLRSRIIMLQARIANAIDLYEEYTLSLALDELDRRQDLLQRLLEQARLELAKTYDQSSGQQ